ncbi:hypothetical protein J6590_026529, partial [Homalodisca vitripennis]
WLLSDSASEAAYQVVVQKSLGLVLKMATDCSTPFKIGYINLKSKFVIETRLRITRNRYYDRDSKSIISSFADSLNYTLRPPQGRTICRYSQQHPQVHREAVHCYDTTNVEWQLGVCVVGGRWGGVKKWGVNGCHGNNCVQKLS